MPKEGRARRDSGMAQTQSDNMESALGHIVVEQGLATANEVQECVAESRVKKDQFKTNTPTLASLLVENGIITRKQLERIESKLNTLHQEKQQKVLQIPGYRLIERIGAGAMATVYKAQQLSLDRTVAIKILPRKYTNNSQFVDRFYAEGRAAAKLNHPHIVQPIDVGQAGDTHYFVMEFIEGRTVFDDISEHGHYKEADALKIIIQTAEALAHAHKAGFIHRDVKPKNIMLTKDNVAKLADMGLARAISNFEAAEAEAGKAYGTPYYISPEQIRGEIDIDFRTDLYSLGATLYQMLTAQVPFDGANPSAVMHKHLKTPITPPDHLNPELSAGIGEVIEICMNKSATRRYNSTADLLEDLKAITRGEPPLQARKKFDLAALTALGATTEPLETIALERRQTGITAQPVFWAMLAGWVVALILFLVLIATIFTQTT